MRWCANCLRFTVPVLVLSKRLKIVCQPHVLVHENDGEDLPGPLCLVALCLVKVQARVEAHLPCR